LEQSGEDRFGDRPTVLAHAGSTITFTDIAGITAVDGILIKLTRVGARIAANIAKLPELMRRSD
jgi:hypothetical protein